MIKLKNSSTKKNLPNFSQPKLISLFIILNILIVTKVIVINDNTIHKGIIKSGFS